MLQEDREVTGEKKSLAAASQAFEDVVLKWADDNVIGKSVDYGDFLPSKVEYSYTLKGDFSIPSPYSSIKAVPVPTPEMLAASMTREEVLAAALEWVNTIRTEYGKEPLTEIRPGLQSRTDSCALVNSLTGIADGSCFVPGNRYRGLTSADPASSGLAFSRDGEVRRYNPPPAVFEFVRRFDQGHFPELVA